MKDGLTDERYFELHLTDEQYLARLKRLRARIADGLPFAAEDSNALGNKYTEASWGLCGETEDLPEDERLFPASSHKGHPRAARASKYKQKQHRCPHDRRGLDPGDTIADMQGCFYTCTIFGHKRGDPPLTQDETVRKFDVAIEHVTRRNAARKGT